VTLQLATGTTLASASPQNCRVQDSPTGPAADGLCISADNVEVWASGMYLTAVRGGFARVLGGGSGLEKDGYLAGALFNLSDIGTLKGEDTLWEAYDGKPEWEFAHINIAYIRIFFTLKGEKWEMLIPYNNQSLEKDDWVTACYNEEYRNNMISRANPIPGLDFKKGDYLFCKPSGADKCAIADFKWFDKTSNQLTSTRPTSPRRFEYLVKYSESTCNKPSGDGPPDVSSQSVSLFANIKQPRFKLYGDFSHGSSSKSNANAQSPAGVSEADWQAHGDAGLPKDPYFIYFLEQTGVTKTGNKFELKLSFDFSNYLVLDGVRDLSSTSVEDALKVITTKDIFLREGTAKGDEFLPNLPVTIDVDVSTAPLKDLYDGVDAGATVEKAGT
jgi:hypothetical protein